MNNIDEKYMLEALYQAKKAYDEDEVPIGCVIVKDGNIIAKSHNTVEGDKKATSHAEINAINEASQVIGDWRLNGATMYITKEPCSMCAGAIVRARIDRLVIGLLDPKRGCAGSVYNLVDDETFNHRVQLTSGVLMEESRKLLQDFFREKRNTRDIDE